MLSGDEGAELGEVVGAVLLGHAVLPPLRLWATITRGAQHSIFVAATDTLRDANVPERAMLDDTRRVWGSHDHATHRDENPRPPRP